MNTNYRFETPDHVYDIVPDLLDSDLVAIRSIHKDSIEEFLGNLELAGVANDESFEDIRIQEDTYQPIPEWYIEISKADLALYFQFEVLNYMGAVVN